MVFSYRRLSDVMCADRHWKLVYRWISAHITLLAEHPPISGSFLFFSITITRIRKNYSLLSRLFQWNFRALSADGKLSRVFFEIFRLTTLKSLSARPEISEFAVSETKIRQFSGQNRANHCVIQSISHRHSLPFTSSKATSCRTENSCRTSDLL